MLPAEGAWGRLCRAPKVWVGGIGLREGVLLEEPGSAAMCHQELGTCSDIWEQGHCRCCQQSPDGEGKRGGDVGRHCREKAQSERCLVPWSCSTTPSNASCNCPTARGGSDPQQDRAEHWGGSEALLPPNAPTLATAAEMGTRKPSPPAQTRRVPSIMQAQPGRGLLLCASPKAELVAAQGLLGRRAGSSSAG